MRVKWIPITFLLVFAGIALHAQQAVTLEEVIALALEKNYDVELARNYSQATRVDDRMANAAFLPTINATGQKVWNSNDQRQRVLRNDGSDTLRIADDAKSENISGQIQMSWTLFDGTKMFATRRRIAEINDQGEILLKDQMANTVAMIITSYYDIVRQKQQLRAIEEQMSVGEERVKLAERKLEVGTGIKPELLQAQVDLNAQRALVIQQQTVIEQLKQQLNGLVSMRLPSTYEVADTIVIDYNIRPGQLDSNVEMSNFSLQASRRDVQIAQLALHERRGEYLPRLNFNYNLNYSITEAPVVVNNFTPLYNRNRGFNYGFFVTIPVFNGLNQRRVVQQAKINVNRQQILYDQLKTNISIGVTNAFFAYDNAKRILLVEEQTISLAKENVSIAFEGFKRGVTTFIELRVAQQSLADAYNRLITARYNTKVAETELLRLSGALIK